MAQTYLKKIDLASKAECRSRRKLLLIILITMFMSVLFQIAEYRVEMGRDTVSYFYQGEWLEPSDELYKVGSYDGIFGLGMLFVTAFLGLFVVHGVFSDLGSKQVADVQLSLPMSAKERYLSKLLAVFKLHILPMLTGSALAVILGSIIKGGFDVIAYPIKMQLIALAVALFTDAMTIFCMTCCGARAEGIYTSVIAQGCLSLLPFLAVHMIRERYSGLTNSGVDRISKVFSCLGDIVILWAEADSRELSNGFGYILVNILASGLIIFASFFTYRRRDGRQVGKPMVSKLFMEVFMCTGVFTLLLLSFNETEWYLGVSVSLIIYLVISVVLARAKITPVRILAWLGKYTATLAVFLGIMCASYITGGFGHYKYRIDPNTNMGYCSILFHTYDDSNGEVFSHYEKEDKLEGVTYRKDKTDTAGVSREELAGNIEAVNEMLDKYLDFEGRTVSGFLRSYFEGTGFDTLDERRNGSVAVSIEVHYSVLDNGADLTDNRYSEYVFNVTREEAAKMNKMAEAFMEKAEPDESEYIDEVIYE
ncbi:hypothetical protein [Ruminococcus sp.]|uniref:hypothetical protein n=1 Tax=Ruminococcus sp. TaxID=41978 RepID=UPI0025F0A181|nr:hypothetical protein [Ruminococcus sp.]MBQ8966638.1 hypothetical protein [Ruminococcus sp.]